MPGFPRVPARNPGLLDSAASPDDGTARIRPRRVSRCRLGSLARALVIVFAVLQTGETFGQAEWCGELQNAFGPFDYTDPANANHLWNVNANHFAPQVRNLTAGQAGYIGGDLDYLLRAFPNHHLALDAMARLSAKEGTAKPRGAQYTVACYFERAVRFKDDDPTVRLLYAKFLARGNQRDQVLVHLQEASKLAPEDANIKYNLGLALFELKRYDEALKAAHQAYALGFPLDGLRKKLESVGKWQPKQR